ncbi:DUF3871 family protein [Epilithonimonas lactis]|uniref:DUF3871 family protein n=1 Tax=Epilithonimonas lactis TaxID=421072 RepID=A0A085BMF8_9FLAO|nr:DUF3871 family protein [Epilithonimonas lactis]KFC23653.1 hypothetical protein IO89_03495 [Epilithonimonas lactis]SEQ20740.1 protein of unknown function [Epilithonimonas lactis]
METKNKIKPATLEEAFGNDLLKTPNIIDISFNKDYPVSRLVLQDSGDPVISGFQSKNIFEDANIFYPSKMNEATLINNEIEPETKNIVQAFSLDKSYKNSESETITNHHSSTSNLALNGNYLTSPFILANTMEVQLHHLKNDCIIPVFSKDNEKTIAHQEFIGAVISATQRAFPNQSITAPEIRVSHQIKGRTPDALYLNVKDLSDHQKTIYYERMAFIIRIPSITDVVNGNELSLCVGGVRSYNLENLYNKKTFEKFKFFIGFQNKVCCNLCVSTDGFLAELKVSNTQDLYSKVLETIQNYNAEVHLMEMKELTQGYLSEHQFAQLIGKSRLYQHLPKLERENIPTLNFTDSHINTMAKDYYEDKNFCRLEDGRINLWDVYNLFTQANKSSYIDTFLDRNLNAFDFSKGLQKTLSGNECYHWFLS